MRKSLKNRYQTKLNAAARHWSDKELAASAIVIAPQQDDETLGCGATIAAKKNAGASVRILFMTDGTRSNAHWIDNSQLGPIRKQETLAAGEIIGVSPDDVHFLGFPDGNLKRHRAAAIERLRTFLIVHPAQQIFVPYRGDWSEDHVTTRHIFYDAAAPLDQRFTVYEYPIWFWRRWPWSARPHLGWRKMLIEASDAAKWSWAVRFQLRPYACDADTLERKRRALQQHRSQIARSENNPRWSVLTDVGRGEFLDCFFQRYELFYRRET